MVTLDLPQDLETIDSILNEGNISELQACLEQLECRCHLNPKNPHYFWRLGKACSRLFVKTHDKAYVIKGIEACEAALKMKPDLANVHKWYAILVGERSQFQSTKKKIADGYLFKEHLDLASDLNPADPTLHFLKGRFAYDVSELKWYERKMASALFATLPTATVEEALEHFMEAQRLSSVEWKMNMLYIAKCKLKMGHKDEAMAIVARAQRLPSVSDAVRGPGWGWDWSLLVCF